MLSILCVLAAGSVLALAQPSRVVTAFDKDWRFIQADPAGAQAPAAAAAGAPKELNPTQEWRQKGFDEKTTTDDHGMQAFGIAKDQYGNKYLMIKNSWGDSGKYHGIWYMSDAYCRGKVIDICVHKDAIPRAIRQKLGI